MTHTAPQRSRRTPAELTPWRLELWQVGSGGQNDLLVNTWPTDSSPVDLESVAPGLIRAARYAAQYRTAEGNVLPELVPGSLEYNDGEHEIDGEELTFATQDPQGTPLAHYVARYGRTPLVRELITTKHRRPTNAPDAQSPSEPCAACGLPADQWPAFGCTG